MTIPEEPAYEKLMYDVEQFIENPGDEDVRVDQVFTPTMFQELDEQLQKVGWKSMQSYWENDFSSRKIVSNFLKDPELGSKRLVSMPDRVTNLIHTADGRTLYRPSVISMYDEDLPDLDAWWKVWQTFLFDTTVPIESDGATTDKTIWSMLLPIQKSKYPAITEEEEVDSLPLQTMSVAIFDAILVHMLNTVSKPAVWQPLKRKIVQSLGKQKIPKTLGILSESYRDSDIITLQEVSSAMIEEAKQHEKLGQEYTIVAPADMDAVRDQNSVILLRKSVFPDWPEEITSQVYDAFPKDGKVPVSNGDIVVIKTTDVKGVPYVVASFHGDTNGLATKPVLDAIVHAMESDSSLVHHRLIFGLDANTYEHAKPSKQQDVLDWATHYTSFDLTSCWGDKPNPKNYSTYNARTYIQPQLNKACPKDGECSMADINPKDFILFPKADFEVVSTFKDNTGHRRYTEGMAFPTLNFPSDHGVLHTTLRFLDGE